VFGGKRPVFTNAMGKKGVTKLAGHLLIFRTTKGKIGETSCRFAPEGGKDSLGEGQKKKKKKRKKGQALIRPRSTYLSTLGEKSSTGEHAVQ